MSWLSDAWAYAWRKNPHKHAEEDMVLPDWHIYKGTGLEGACKTQKQLNKRYHKYHYMAKGKLFVPALFLADKLFKKYKQEAIPDYWYNDNLRLFNSAFDDAQRILAFNYIWRLQPQQLKETNLQSHPSMQALRKLKELTLMMALNDTVYREFLNIFVLELGQQAAQKYGTTDPNNPTYVSHNHLFYPSACYYNVNYYIIGQKIRGKIILEKTQARNYDANRQDKQS